MKEDGGSPIADLELKLQAGMQAEACAAARKLFTASERMRSASARCEPVEAIPYADFLKDLRKIIAEQGC
ncbi:hypothetical protein VP06_05460 [Methylobacterium aquaticum]|uniref:Uncharacterized protein n=1 Tax=Methylobacterium aquaticum TaxID=270351 RepID=A0A0J6SYQ7_9HYPH|nr:hypothetical protein VP06_05460 [Methylobacterium aquaticum]